MKSELVNIVAHDFRAPLAGVLGHAELLEWRPDAPREERLEPRPQPGRRTLGPRLPRAQARSASYSPRYASAALVRASTKLPHSRPRVVYQLCRT